MTTDPQRRRRLVIFGGGLLLVITAVAIAIAVSSGGSSSSTTFTTTATAPAKSEFAGIPQTGNVLGDPNAKATLMVFADMQCPFCGEFERGAFPSIVKRYVKTGKLKVIFQPISILGTDSVVGSKAVAAAAAQKKFFDYAAAFYANQGQENTGYVTSDFLTKLAKSVPGLDVAKWQQALNSGSGATILTAAQTAAQTARVSSTPTFMVAKNGQTLEQFQPNDLTAQAFYAKLDSLTG
ncbi:MAG TPA: thioredoxin domain-containing protein [Thermoleophilaceae bacterium]|jgi:protein-disulfide isomerase|nr:thioredoxin domain-containing protein [Thermoleophilaceae bacterium]